MADAIVYHKVFLFIENIFIFLKITDNGNV